MSENEATIEVAEEKKWAIDMTQADFDIEWMRRNPVSDVIPDVKMWLYPSGFEDRGMTPIQDHEYEEEVVGQKTPEVKDEETPKTNRELLTCPGCGFVAKEKKYPSGKLMLIGIKAHMRKCKEIIANG